MAYSKTTWSTGDTITAAKMNKIEQGVYDAHNGSGSSGGITTETDPTVPSWAKQSAKPSYSFSEINNTPTTLEGYGITDAVSYDIIIACNHVISSSSAKNVNYWSIIKGNISDLETKLEANLPITGLAILWTEAWSMDPPNDARYYLPLTYMHGPYHLLFFSQIVNQRSPSTSGISAKLISVNFDYNDNRQLNRVDYQEISL